MEQRRIPAALKVSKCVRRETRRRQDARLFHPPGDCDRCRNGSRGRLGRRGDLDADASAQGGAAAGTNWVAITAGFSMAIASAVCGIAQAKATAAAAEGLARNPAARPGIQLALILGLALIESLALYTLVIIFAKVK